MDDSQSSNLNSESNVINSFDQYVASGNNHFNDDDLVDVCDHDFPSASANILVAHEYFNLKYDLVKEDVPIETSSSSRYPLCSTVFDASICDRDTPFSLISSSLSYLLI